MKVPRAKIFNDMLADPLTRRQLLHALYEDRSAKISFQGRVYTLKGSRK